VRTDQVAVVGPDREVIVWDCTHGRAVRTYRGHEARVSVLAFSRDGKRLASAGGDRAVRVWDLGHEPGGRTLADLGGRADSLAVSADGTRLVAGPRFGGYPGDHTLTVLDAATGRTERVIPGSGDAALSPDGRVLAAGQPGSGVLLWDVATGAEVRRLPDPAGDRRGGRLVFSPDGSRLAHWCPTGGVRVTTLADGGTKVLAPGGALVYGLAFSPDGSRLAAAAADGVTVWDADTGAATTWEDGPREAFAVAFSPDRATVVVSERGAVRARAATTGQVVQSFAASPLRVNAVAYSPDGARLVTGGSDGTVRVWDAASGQELVTLLAGATKVTGVAWAGDRVFATAGGPVLVWRPGSDR